MKNIFYTISSNVIITIDTEAINHNVQYTLYSGMQDCFNNWYTHS